MEEKKKREIDEFERSITIKYRAKIWSKFVAAIKEYDMLKPGDHVCVCISGGKDSMLLARLFMQLLKHSDFEFKVSYLVMNPGYNQRNMDLIKHNLERLSIPATIVETNIFDVAAAQDRSPCFLCAKMRRGALYNHARQLGCNKIALGHHFDDAIETTLMNMLNSGSFQTMLPKLRSTNFEGMELIRPMYLIREKDILSWKRFHNLEFIACACKMTEKIHEAGDGVGDSQRAATKKLIQELVKNYNPMVETNIFSAANNVTMDMIVGYKKKGKYHSFLEEYDIIEEPQKEVIPYRKRYDKTYAELNSSWINERYQIDDEDLKLFNGLPKIVDKGGMNYYVKLKQEILGCATVDHLPNGDFILRTITTKENYRNQGVGTMLLQAAISWSANHGGKVLNVLLNELDVELISLLKKNNFKEINLDLKLVCHSRECLHFALELVK